MSTTVPSEGYLPHVLVLLATYNGVRWLPDQLETLLAQQGVRISILISDDGSSDGTLQVAADLALRHPCIEVLPPSEVRLGAAGNFFRLLRSAALEHIDYVALCDQDDLWLPGRLAGAIAQIEEQDAAGYSSDALAFWPDGRERRLKKASPQRSLDFLFEPAGPGCTYVVGAALARSLQQELRREPERFAGIGYHDWLIYAYARLHGQRWVIDPAPTVRYRQHSSNELGANFGLAGIRRRWGRLTSGWFRGQVLQIANLWPRVPRDFLLRLTRLRWKDRLWLAARARHLRRRPRDQLALALMLILQILR